ncbi:MAG: EAL domain-containing protein [Ruminococcus sp.]|nr:EAL domain-containing protein [Ruminococcus sp.]
MRHILRYLGFEKQSKHVKDYFFMQNMKASIYMSVVIIVLELWMIIRLTRIIMRDESYDQIPYFFRRYYSNYFMLITTGIIMLLFSIRYVKGQSRNKTAGTALMIIFTFICLLFGIKVSLNDYGIGEQILTLLTMEMFAVCLLNWRPFISCLILTSSYLYMYCRMDSMVAVNTGLQGTTVATRINFFIMWISTMMVCISNYNNTLAQALKDENLEKINSHLSRISVLDELTGIHNMHYFRTEADKVLSYVTTDRTNTVFLFFDIENFKSYNEKYGFHRGNELLKEFAEALSENFSHSLVSRFSDDHYVVLTSYDGFQEKVDNLAKLIHELQGDVQLSLKCGAYRPDDDEHDPSIACDRARFACNSIKKHYTTTVCMYDALLERRFQQKQYIVNNIDNAIQNGFIKVYYQPVISVKDGYICGLEALARWEDPEYGLLPPGAFIDILEEYRQIYKLDQCIIEQVCRDHSEAVSKGEKFPPVSINLSRLDFELCDIVGFLCDMTEKYSVPRDHLDIEITESALTEKPEQLQQSMAALRSSGFSIWLDDFGSGYSSLNVLKDYHFDVLKIDMKFLAGLGTNEKAGTILSNIINLTKQLNMCSLTEGVEHEEQFRYLSSIGCTKAQGYFFSKPVTLEKLKEMVRSGKLKLPPETGTPVT